MKILGVKFKNINSLAGEWEIRFDRAPISDTGLFAIVGPNGSGKSSILDAITLGLYGETARLRSPETESLNLQGKETYAEVTFSVKAHRYCSRWSVQKDRENPQPPEMSLFSLNGEKTLMESRSIPVRNRISELTGLDFKRFCRSILLAQGEFSAFLNALENERAEILEKIIGPEILRELEESIRTRAGLEAERLHRLKEEAAGFQTPDRAREDKIRQFMEQAREDIREIGRELETLRYLEGWLERAEREPLAGKNAADALRMAETRYAEALKKLEHLEQARPAGFYKEALAQVDALNAKSEAAQDESLHLKAVVAAREEQRVELEARLEGICQDLDAARKLLAERSGILREAAALDHDIAELEALFLNSVSRLETITREQRDASRMRSELDEKKRNLDERIQELLNWIEAHAGEENLDAEIPAMDSHLAQLVTIGQENEKFRKQKSDALKTEGQAAKSLRHAEAVAQKIRSKVERLRTLKTDRDERLLAIYEGRTQEGLKADIARGAQKLAACKALGRIGRKGAAFRSVRDEMAENQSRMDFLTQSIATEQSRLQALEGQIRRRDTIRRFDPDRSTLHPGEPCPLCGASTHPFLENGGLDFSELDRIVREREEKIRSQQVECESLQSRYLALQVRYKALEELHQEWDRQCAAAGEAWDFGDTDLPSESIRTVRNEIRSARSKIRSAWWQAWRSKWTGRALGKKLEKLSRRETLLEAERGQHEACQNRLNQIEDDLKRLDENEGVVRSALFDQFRRWQEPQPDPGSENLPVERLKQRSEIYRRKRQERMDAADELHLMQPQQQAFSGVLQRIEDEMRQLSGESESLQIRLNALKADRQTRYGVIDPVRERQLLESQVEELKAKEQSLTQEVETLSQGLSADREALERLQEQVRQIRNEADTMERSLLEQSMAAGFGSLNDIRNGLSILQGEPEVMIRLAGAEDTLTAAREALEALQPKHTTQDSLETVRWKISDAIKRQKELEKDIDGSERTLEKNLQAERVYRELLQAIAVQEKIFTEAMEASRGIEGQGEAGGKLQQLLLKQLLEETNRHLNLLSSGRYALKPAGENFPGLHIEDALQARAMRSVKTLSGGESFLVSLCLALGLSDMAGRHRKIESLFLDEGFGVLDEEMLYKVISALKNLRANGKTVGIVSHVKRLAAEIPTQIRLEKEPGGSSRITVVA